MPVAAPESLAELESEADDCIAVEVPADLMAIGQYYVDFRQTSDEEVVELLARATPPPGESLAVTA